MTQKCIFTFFILSLVPFFIHGMKFNKLGHIDTQLLKLYAKKIGTQKLLDQLKHCRPMRQIEDPSSPWDVIRYEKFPCISFKSIFIQDKQHRRLWDVVQDDVLTAIIFTKIKEIESKDGHIPEHIVTEGKDFVSVRMPNNWLDRHTRYWYKRNVVGFSSTECSSTFFHEDKEAIEEALS